MYFDEQSQDALSNERAFLFAEREHNERILMKEILQEESITKIRIGPVVSGNSYLYSPKIDTTYGQIKGKYFVGRVIRQPSS